MLVQVYCSLLPGQEHNDFLPHPDISGVPWGGLHQLHLLPGSACHQTKLFKRRKQHRLSKHVRRHHHDSELDRQLGHAEIQGQVPQHRHTELPKFQVLQRVLLQVRNRIFRIRCLLNSFRFGNTFASVQTIFGVEDQIGMNDVFLCSDA